ncbi:Murein DD-endopeptidase MepM and murein hydrolase activator NlpD, contain LysM domain [Rhizobiales bacterium GAS191]|jgi:murein DD-endopeptidase MepM/ murein hydrolase activator NlpD|nr:Murein DD-endopeptidase MepM and murein hydrolase activator NlpD, contain LysM domain [Rhizobiales bacterium GAS113]SED61349.1 Murein DD-endopeptidase MepM and murein hydrolase activator NlpD, contain LysM domain [Rhizobiales bacterium GAS191]SEE77109.1 Murein DD-endopeptidase MepM and murein hydrolase activator NlpD, contain LysM domain [Rhizobiales bacterium GAS188]
MRSDTNRQSSSPLILSRVTVRIAFATLVAMAATGCSSEAMRFSDNPFTSPFGGGTADATPPVPAVPTGKVQSRSLPAVGSQASLSQPDTSIVTGSIRPRASTQPVKQASFGNWSTVGGTTMTLASGDTIATLSSRYGVPETALRGANGLASGANPAPGSQIVIPVYRYGPAVGQSSPAKAVDSATPTLSGHKSEPPRLAATAPAKKPTAESQKAAAVPSEQPAKLKTATAAPPQPAKPKEMAKAEPADDVDPSLATGAVKPDSPQFRWPARGRVISRFGGDGNDGINISVPEGTSVRAAEDGTVAYVGDEIKGYGKLVLVRHSNGWVSAYANNGDLLVKKGEAVKRGQVLAKSGQTGNVASPQLHFELRKGKTPVDPQQFLAGG